jgi:hypothetical protein
MATKGYALDAGQRLVPRVGALPPFKAERRCPVLRPLWDKL